MIKSHTNIFSKQAEKIYFQKGGFLLQLVYEKTNAKTDRRLQEKTGGNTKQSTYGEFTQGSFRSPWENNFRVGASHTNFSANG